MSNDLRVYISFAEEDRLRVRELEHQLRSRGFETWFDENNLTTGSDWKEVIRQEIPRSDAFLSCISTGSISRRGFYDKEIATALKLRKKRPGFVIPVRLNECELPSAYQDHHLTPVDLFEKGGFGRLVRALQGLATVNRNIVQTRGIGDTPRTRRILHLSDLHFTRDHDHLQLLAILEEDLTKIANDGIDYLVVSGDLSDRCNEAGYENAREFLTKLQSDCSIPREHCVLVPGNHDVQRDLGAFELSEKVTKDAVKLLAGDLETVLYLVRKPGSYGEPFRRFAAVYKSFTGLDYELSDPGKQVRVLSYPADRLQFLGLNSAWQIDQFRPKRSSLHGNALDEGCRQLRENRGYLGIAVWHHAVTGNDKIESDQFLGRLGEAGVRLCLHGDVHELRPDVVNPYSSNRIHIIGCGALGASAQGRPESTPRMYNLLDINDDRTRARVRTRQQSKAGALFEAYATWSVPGQRDLRSGVYEFAIEPPP